MEWIYLTKKSQQLTLLVLLPCTGLTLRGPSVLLNNPSNTLIYIDEETEAQEVKEPKAHS